VNTKSFFCAYYFGGEERRSENPSRAHYFGGEERRSENPSRHRRKLKWPETINK